MNHPKLGKYTPDGMIYPTETITGKPYARGEYDPPPAIVHDIPDGYFAVGDVFPPRDFDLNGALDALKALVKPAAAAPAKKEDKP